MRRDEIISRVRNHLRDEENIVKAFQAHPTVDNVRFACDYSEIFAYSFVFSNGRSDLGYATGYEADRQIALNEAWSNRLFFRKDEPVLLLPTYKIELDNLVKRIHLHPLAEVAAAITHIQRLRDADSKLLKWLEQLETQLDAALRNNLTQSLDAFSILSSIYENSPALLLLMSEELKPQSRLKHLLNNGSFLNADDEEAKIGSIQGLPETEAFWEGELRAHRPNASHSTNIIDAKAIATLQAINANHRTDKSVILIARSEIMRDILWRNRHKKECIDVYIAHPRIIGSYMSAEQAGRSPSELIKERYRLSREILDELDYDKTHSMPAFNSHRDVALERIDNVWNELDSFSIARAVWVDGKGWVDGKPTPSTFGKAGEKTIEAISKFVKNRSSVKELLASRSIQIATDIRLGNANLATAEIAQSGGHPTPTLQLQSKSYRSQSTEKTSITIRSPSKTMPYSLQIYDSAFRGRIRAGVDLSDALGRILAQDSEAIYEQLLVTGYMLASLGEWSIAFEYFDIATTIDARGVPQQEAFYFRALARRHVFGMDTAQLIENSKNDLFTANAIKKAWRGTEYWDPRYLNELGVLLASGLHTSVDLSWADQWNRSPIALWNYTLKRIIDDLLLKTQVFNNKVYHMFEKKRFYKRDEIKEAFTDFSESLSNLDARDITYGVEHTLIILSFWLSDRGDIAKRSAEQKLTKLLSDPVPPSLRTVIVADIKALEGGHVGFDT
ncbi:hypothetical protein [Siccirubricoccus phaeus]|uniref:hypothetical protein n=1 Tax=Siccirubricoccus phaeus TaxID=2595053 RepID=UPI0011F31C63|nr:hypothetical protein [Siccirubricoccus phaeus]